MKFIKTKFNISFCLYPVTPVIPIDFLCKRIIPWSEAIEGDTEMLAWQCVNHHRHARCGPGDGRAQVRAVRHRQQDQGQAGGSEG